jgi:hypothetical protein
MTGCFGNSMFDKDMERQVNKYCQDYDKVYCEVCGFKGIEDDCNYIEDKNALVCPKCKNLINL